MRSWEQQWAEYQALVLLPVHCVALGNSVSDRLAHLKNGGVGLPGLPVETVVVLLVLL